MDSNDNEAKNMETLLKGDIKQLKAKLYEKEKNPTQPATQTSADPAGGSAAAVGGKNTAMPANMPASVKKAFSSIGEYDTSSDEESEPSDSRSDFVSCRSKLETETVNETNSIGNMSDVRTQDGNCRVDGRMQKAIRGEATQVPQV